MTAEGISRLQGRLKIHRRAGTQVTESSQIESLDGHVGSKSIPEQLSCSEAATLHADAVSDADTARIQAIELDDHLHIAAARLQHLYAPNVLNNSSKHLCSYLLRRTAAFTWDASADANHRRSVSRRTRRNPRRPATIVVPAGSRAAAPAARAASARRKVTARPRKTW